MTYKSIKYEKIIYLIDLQERNADVSVVYNRRSFILQRLKGNLHA